MPELCEQQLRRATFTSPAEWCENEAVEGSEFCDSHQPYEPDPDRQKGDWW